MKPALPMRRMVWILPAMRTRTLRNQFFGCPVRRIRAEYRESYG